MFGSLCRTLLSFESLKASTCSSVAAGVWAAVPINLAVFVHASAVVFLKGKFYCGLLFLYCVSSQAIYAATVSSCATGDRCQQICFLPTSFCSATSVVCSLPLITPFMSAKVCAIKSNRCLLCAL